MSKITESARNQACTVRIPGICNFDPRTTVAAHKNGAGMGIKNSDLFIAYACSDCHSWLDGGYTITGHSRHERDAEHHRAILETQKRLLDQRLIILV